MSWAMGTGHQCFIWQHQEPGQRLRLQSRRYRAVHVRHLHGDEAPAVACGQDLLGVGHQLRQGQSVCGEQRVTGMWPSFQSFISATNPTRQAVIKSQHIPPTGPHPPNHPPTPPTHPPTPPHLQRGVLRQLGI
jgi:hypothetical protein